MYIKSEKGVTLVALTVYILVFTMLIGVITTISTFFFGRVGEVVDTPKYIYEFNKFSMFFVADIKKYNEADVSDFSIEFKDGPVYKYQNNIIYRNDIEISKNILNCKFTLKQYSVNTKTKNIINVNMQIGNNNNNIVNRSVDFTLKYW